MMLSHSSIGSLVKSRLKKFHPPVEAPLDDRRGGADGHSGDSDGPRDRRRHRQNRAAARQNVAHVTKGKRIGRHPSNDNANNDRHRRPHRAGDPGNGDKQADTEHNGDDERRRYQAFPISMPVPKTSAPPSTT